MSTNKDRDVGLAYEAYVETLHDDYYDPKHEYVEKQKQKRKREHIQELYEDSKYDDDI